MKNWLVMIIMLISTPWLFYSCKSKSQNAGEIGARIHLKEKVSEYKVPVRIARISRGSIQEKITIYGKLAPKQETLLSSQFSGRILNLTLSKGDRVKKGQVVATIQSPKAEALQQTTSKTSAKTRKFSQELLPISIYSPVEGIVTRKFHFSGDVAASGEPILNILDDSVLYLWGQLPAVYLPQIKVGKKLKVFFPDLASLSFQAKIETINSTVDKRTQMAQIRASLPNPNHILKSDLFAKIEIIVKSLKNVLLVPRMAVLADKSGYFVYIEKGGTAHRRSIKAGIKNPDNFEVKSGLNDGERVIIVGNYELKDGMEVEIIS